MADLNDFNIEYRGNLLAHVTYMGLDRQELEEMAREDPNRPGEGDWILTACSFAVMLFLAVAALAYFTRYFQFGP